MPRPSRKVARRDLRALQDAVNGGDFLFAGEPCVYDFAIASFMAGCSISSPPHG